jgi:hypothetical protein
MSIRTTIRALFVSVAVSALFAAPAAAQRSYGLRAGVSAEPDQFYFGGHLETGPLVDRLVFRPNVEIGVGNDTTLVGLNFELAYKFQTRHPWQPYALGGPALNIVHTNGDSEAQGGFNFGLGLEHRGGLFAEVKVGVIDSASFKFGIGYRFR